MPTKAKPSDGVPSEDAIRHRAYLLWEADGRPEGMADHYWMKASESAAPKATKPAKEKPAPAKPKAAKAAPKVKAAAAKVAAPAVKAAVAAKAPARKAGAAKATKKA